MDFVSSWFLIVANFSASKIEIADDWNIDAQKDEEKCVLGFTPGLSKCQKLCIKNEEHYLHRDKSY